MADITQEMLQAGARELSQHNFGSDLEMVALNVYQAMKVADEPKAPWLQLPLSSHPESAELSKYLWEQGSDRAGNFNVMASYSVYYPSLNDTLYSITTASGNMDGQKLPFRNGWNVFHDDKQLIVYLPGTQEVVEFYGASVSHTYKKITAKRASKVTVSQLQHPPSRGSGIPYHHMLITDQEVQAGVIDHALSLRVRNPRRDEAWYPASKVENHPDAVIGGVPEGARFLMTFTQDRIDAWAAQLAAKHPDLKIFGLALARALSTYGFFITDNGGGTASFDLQHPETWGTVVRLRSYAIANPGVVRDMLDGLLQASDLRLCQEIGPRITV